MVKWQSELYPELKLTDDHYAVLRPRLRYIESFRDEMEKAEIWLNANPAKAPKKNWKRFVANWMMNANKYAQSRAHPQKHFSKEAKPILDALTGSMRASTPPIKPNEQFRCKACDSIHSPGFRCAKLLGII